MAGPVVLIIAIVLCLLGNGFFSGSEIAVISAKRSRIQALADEGSKAALRVQRLQDNPDSFLATVQIGVTLMGTLAGVLGGYLASRHVEPALSGATRTSRTCRGRQRVLVGAGIVYVELILGELVPKALALRYAESAALVVSWPLLMLSQASQGIHPHPDRARRAPCCACSASATRRATRSSRMRRSSTWFAKARSRASSTQSEMEMIHSVFDFSDTPVSKVMVPRPKIFALDADTPPTEVANAHRRGRLLAHPGLRGVGGQHHRRRLRQGRCCRLLEKRQPVVLRKLLHPVHFVPETKKVGELLKDLQKRRIHMALVHRRARLGRRASSRSRTCSRRSSARSTTSTTGKSARSSACATASLVVEGTVSAATLRERYQVPIPESSEFETVAGFMLDRLGSVPRGGEVVALGGYRLTVVDVEKNRISKVKIEKVA